jgi:hypothetical protein
VTPATLVEESAPVVQQALAFPDQARALRISDATTYQTACEFLKGVKALRGKIADTFGPHITRAHDAHKSLIASKADAEAPLAEAERVVKAALIAFDQAESKARQAEVLRLQAEARRQELERRTADAQALMDAGECDEAQALLESDLNVAVVAIAPATPKISGISFRESWSANVEDIVALIQYVAQHPQFVGLLQANQPALNAQARSLKQQMQIPGVKAVCTRDVAAGKR